MIEQFYIIEEGEKTGPFDLVAMIKKIRNGKLKATDEVMNEEMEEPARADTLAALAPYFAEMDGASLNTDNGKQSLHKLDVAQLLRDAWVQFNEHQSMSIFAGAGCFILLILSLIFTKALPPVLVTLLIAPLGGIMLAMFQVYVFYKVRGRAIDAHFSGQFGSPRGKRLMLYIAGLTLLCFGLPGLIALFIGSVGFLLLIPGTLAYGLFIFAPFIWAEEEENQNVKEMLGASKTWLLAQDVDSIGAILFIVAINFVASLVFLFPVFISLPVTMIALADIYDHYFTRNI